MDELFRGNVQRDGQNFSSVVNGASGRSEGVEEIFSMENDIDMLNDTSSLGGHYKERPSRQNATWDVAASTDCVSSTQSIKDGSSIMDSAIELRRQSFRQFLMSVPRIVSPTTFGLSEYKHGDGIKANESVLSENIEFNWSIDQIAVLNPCDFSSHENPSFLHEIDQEIQDSRNKENQEYFSRHLILPSPDLNLSLNSSRKKNYDNFLKPNSFDNTSGVFMRVTPSKDKVDFSNDLQDFDGKSQTPLNMSKVKQKKKLFTPNGFDSENFRDNDEEEIGCGALSDISMSSIANCDNVNGNCSFSKLEHSLSFLSPILSKSRFERSSACNESELSAEHHDENLAMVTQLPMIQEESSSDMVVSLASDDYFSKELAHDSDSGCNMKDDANRLDKNPFKNLLLKTSTPSNRK